MGRIPLARRPRRSLTLTQVTDSVVNVAGGMTVPFAMVSLAILLVGGEYIAAFRQEYGRP